MRIAGLGILVMIAFNATSQGIKVEYDKHRDFSKYITFRVGEGEVTTPKDNLAVSEAQVHRWMKKGIIEKLTSKGLLACDSAADLTVTYVISSLKRNEQIDLGMQIFGGVSGNTPSATNAPSRTWSRDIQDGSLVVDLHDRNNNLVWRIRATTGGETADYEQLIYEVVNSGFRKLSLKPKKVKKNK
jgi:hypothetical protein